MGKTVISGTTRQAWEESCTGDFTAKESQHKGLGLLGLMGWLGFLIILLVALVAVASWARQSGRQRLTRQCLAAVGEALVVYRQAEGEFPPTVASSVELLKYLKSSGPARQRLEVMPEHVFRSTSEGPEILDGWSRPLRYVFEGGPGGRPELISQGPDGNDQSDDIRAEGLQAVFTESSTKGQQQ